MIAKSGAGRPEEGRTGTLSPCDVPYGFPHPDRVYIEAQGGKAKQFRKFVRCAECVEHRRQAGVKDAV